MCISDKNYLDFIQSVKKALLKNVFVYVKIKKLGVEDAKTV